MPDSIDNLTLAINRFADERNWEQFHSPKNLAMALNVEAGELMEHFQWLTQQQSREVDDQQCRAVSLEMADVLIYLVRMADQLNIDLLQAAGEKMAINAEKYPVDTSCGHAEKFTDYRQKP